MSETTVQLLVGVLLLATLAQRATPRGSVVASFAAGVWAILVVAVYQSSATTSWAALVLTGWMIREALAGYIWRGSVRD